MSSNDKTAARPTSDGPPHAAAASPCHHYRVGSTRRHPPRFRFHPLVRPSVQNKIKNRRTRPSKRACGKERGNPQPPPAASTPTDRQARCALPLVLHRADSLPPSSLAPTEAGFEETTDCFFGLHGGPVGWLRSVGLVPPSLLPFSFHSKGSTPSRPHLPCVGWSRKERGRSLRGEVLGAAMQVCILCRSILGRIRFFLGLSS
jgi:hypothetical protein